MWSLNGWWFDVTEHAIQRALDMALTEDDIRGVLGNPRDIRRGRAGRELWTRGKLTAVMEEDEGYWKIITFVWATPNAWVQDAEHTRSRGDQHDLRQSTRFRTAVKNRKRHLGGRP